MLPFNFCGCVLIVSALFLVLEVRSQECGRSYSITSEEGKPVNATEESWPWVVAIFATDGNKNGWVLCSGFLIDDIHVLTAAHCIDGYWNAIDKLTVKLGSLNPFDAEEYLIDCIIKHDGYRYGSYYDDLAIVKLTIQVGYRKFNPVCLPEARDSSGKLWPDNMVQRQPMTGLITTEVGWESPILRLSNRNMMQLSGFKIISNSQCTSKLKYIVTDFEQMFPRGINNSIICGIVSEKDYLCLLPGSPLMYLNGDQWIAVGIASFGQQVRVGWLQGECGGLGGIPEGFTRIATYLPWIRKNTRRKRN